MKKRANPPSNLQFKFKRDKESLEISLNIRGFAANNELNNYCAQTNTPQLPTRRPQTFLSRIAGQAHSIPQLIAKRILFPMAIIATTLLLVTNLLGWFVTTPTANSLGIQLTPDQVNLIIDKLLDVILRFVIT